MYERSDAALLSGRFHELLQERRRAIAVLEGETSASTLSKFGTGPQTEAFGTQRGLVHDDSKNISYYMQKKVQMHKQLLGGETKQSLKP